MVRSTVSSAIIRQSRCQLRIIREQRANSNENRVGSIAANMDILPGLGTAHPARMTGACGDPAVERHGIFRGGARPAGLNARHESANKVKRLVSQRANLDLNPNSPQLRKPATIYQWVRIAGRRNDPPHSGGDNCAGTGRSATVVAARLQGDVEIRAACQFTGGTQGDDLGVRPWWRLRRAKADDPTVSNQYRTHGRVGRDTSQSRPGLLQRKGHEFPVGSAPGCLRLARGSHAKTPIHNKNPEGTETFGALK